MDQQSPLFESRRPNAGKYSFFLSFFPDPNTAERMIELGNRIRIEKKMHSRLRPLTHLHVSLHFFGYGSDVSESLAAILDPVCKSATAQTPPFEIELDRVMSFRGRPGNHPFVLLGDDQKNADLNRLHQFLEGQLVKHRLSARPNNKFVPHVTLLYDDNIFAPAPTNPLTWKVGEIVLVRSEVGATKYKRTAHWALNG